jgi:hypothetical protein
METAGFCMIDWVMKSDWWYGQKATWSGSRFSKRNYFQIFTNFILVGSSDGVVSHYYMLLNTKTVEQL